MRKLVLLTATVVAGSALVLAVVGAAVVGIVGALVPFHSKTGAPGSR